MKDMRRAIFIMLAALLGVFIAACERESGQGTLKLSITDAPIDTTGLSGVLITINEVQVHTPDSGWETLEEFEGPMTVNLLDLTRGITEEIGNFVLKGGTYTQIRFIVDAPEQNQNPQSNPGCYLLFDDGSIIPLFVPSGSRSGFKATGEFMVPVNDTIKLTADFDVRKSVIKAGNSGKYILKPTIRIIAEGEAGQIRGNVINIPDTTGIVIYAYADGLYTTEESTDPEEGEFRFPNAVSSDIVDLLGVYHIAYLAEGQYDLVVTSLFGDEFGEVLGIIEDVMVESRNTTSQDIDISALE